MAEKEALFSFTMNRIFKNTQVVLMYPQSSVYTWLCGEVPRTIFSRKRAKWAEFHLIPHALNHLASQPAIQPQFVCNIGI